MLKTKMVRHPRYGMIEGIEVSPGDLDPWNATPAQVREVALRRNIVGPNYAPWCGVNEAEADEYAPSQREVIRISELTCEAVRYGRMIDFGFWPNEAIKQGGRRGGPLWSRGFIGMPFNEPWVLFHQWEDGPAVYLVNPRGEKPTCGDIEICELQCQEMQGNPLLCIADRALFQFPAKPITDWSKFGAMMSPNTIRYMPGEYGVKLNNGKSPAGSAAGNVGDPVMLALLILNTRNVERETIHAPAKLNKARLKNRKEPIPPYDVVHSAPYVTAIANRGKRRERGEDQGGTHASPIPHIRLGHPRDYASGLSIFIKDTLVNAGDQARDAFLNRSHYEVR
jgi:hypothetical protein